MNDAATTAVQFPSSEVEALDRHAHSLIYICLRAAGWRAAVATLVGLGQYAMAVSSSPLTLTVWSKDGEQHELEVLGPGGTARVCVGDRHAPHSSVWRIWANRNKSDVYIACRDIAGVQKWSLHETGDWRHQWMTRQYAWHLTKKDDRTLDQWPQPAEREDIGWTRGFAISVRLQDLADYGDGDELPKDIIWMPAPPQDRVAVIHVLIARPDRLDSKGSGIFPFHAFSLANGKVVLVTFSLQPVLAEQEAELQSMLQQITSHPKSAEHIARLSAPRLTATLVDEETGDRGVWDIAIPRSAGGTNETVPSYPEQGDITDRPSRQNWR